MRFVNPHRREKRFLTIRLTIQPRGGLEGIFTVRLLIIGESRSTVTRSLLPTRLGGKRLEMRFHRERLSRDVTGPCSASNATRAAAAMGSSSLLNRSISSHATVP